MNDQIEVKPMINRMTAETRRNQFRQKSASINEARPRLMRAMSAPIRQNPPLDAHEKPTNAINSNQCVTKRRLRRKKIAPIEMDPFNIKITNHQTYPEKIIGQRQFDDRPSTAKSLSSRAFRAAKPPKSTVQPRAKSAVNGCEIVTLVSLLSPSASDSEKEDLVNGNSDGTNDKCFPSLRKVGKSGKNDNFFVVI